MTEAQIQAFLDQKIGVCQNGRCLNVFRANLPTYPAINSTTTGLRVCNEVPGGTNLLASSIIYRVQQACGISAKVILVTLQKEQGLVLSKSPSSYALNFAMGWACPDSTGCVDASSWFGFQVYRGGRQLVTYKIGNFMRQPGVHNILFSPTQSCGSTSVNIRNYATAALYNYTPYQPSEASLAAFPRAASPFSPCNSYGNRNFFFFYNQWFGSTFSVDGPFALDQAYAETGGVGGPLGGQVNASACVLGNSACWREYETGFIGWRSSTGAYSVTGEAAVAFRNAGGPTGRLGYPTTTSNPITGPNGDGSGQNFTGGQVLVSASGAYSLTTRMLPIYSHLGWVRGAIGWPVTDQVCDGTGTCTQQFQDGYLASPASGNVRSVLAGYAEKYELLGGPTGVLGSPQSEANAITGAVGSGSGQNFVGGQMLSSAAGTFVVSATVMATYILLGWVRGSLGWPTGEMTCASGQCSQSFQGGTVVKPTVGAAYVIATGPVGDAYLAAGGPTGLLGLPTTGNNALFGPMGDGSGQNFQNGTILSSAAGAFIMQAPLAAAHADLGWVRGSLGWPTGEMACASGQCSQSFQGGTVIKPASGAAYVIATGPVGDAYLASGGPTGPLGLPTTANNLLTGPMGNGSGQNFQNGTILSSAAGAFIMRAPILGAHANLGWVRGSLGWPTGEMACADGQCSQSFQGGTLTQPQP